MHPNISRLPGEPLTKENFFNEMQEAYPLAMEEFCKWIDEYKEKADWKRLFNEGGCFEEVEKPVFNVAAKAPKFHELPLAIQTGIILAWLDHQDVEIWLWGTEEKSNMTETVILHFTEELEQLHDEYVD